MIIERKAKDVKIDDKELTVDQFMAIVKKSDQPVYAENQYGNHVFYKTIMPYEIIDGELRCKNWKGEILEPPYLKGGQMFKLCQVEWE